MSFKKADWKLRIETLENRRILAVVSYYDPVVVSEEEVPTPADAEIGDIDGDGDADVVSLSHGLNELAWLANSGDGTFSRKQVLHSFPLESGAIHDAIVADFFGGPELDVAWIESDASSQNYRLGWKTSRGGRLEETEFTSTSKSERLSFADFNGDGMLDILTANNQWLANDGKSFRAVDFANNELISQTIAGDIDGDGDQDIVAIESLNETGVRNIRWFQNTDAVFADQGSFSIADKAHDAVMFDVDGDGSLDILLLTANDDQGRIVWFKNEGEARGFSASERLLADNVGRGQIELADLDGDGDRDVVAATYATSFVDDKVVWFENLDDDFSFSVAREISRGSLLPQSIVAGDIDGDGDHDLVTSASGSNAVIWHENVLADATNLDWVDRAVSDIGASLSARLHLMDVDGDGLTDLVSSDALLGLVTVAYATSDGVGKENEGFLKQSIMVADVLGFGDEHFVDFDRDGDMDVVALRGGSRLAWYENVGRSREFQTHSVNSPSAYDGITLADLDFDDDLDLLAWSDATSTPVQVFVNNESKLTPDGSIVLSGRSIADVVAFDFDADGQVELVSLENEDAGYYLTSYERLRGEWAGTEIDARRRQLGLDVMLVDLNSDELLDLLYVADRSSIGFVAYRASMAINNGQTFERAGQISTSQPDVQTTDFYQNGMEDLVTDDIEVYAVANGEIRTDAVHYLLGKAVISTAIDRINADDTQDVAWINLDGSIEVMYRMPGLSGDFTEDGVVDLQDLQQLCTASRSFSPESGSTVYDFNGDGVETIDDRTAYLDALFLTVPGDSNFDRIFNSSDLVAAFQAGKYEDPTAIDVQWAEGDWNCDGRFDSNDLVAAFEAGSFVASSTPSEIAGAIDQHVRQIGSGRNVFVP